MKLQNQALLLSASDLVGHLNCRHLTHLEVEAANGRIKRPHYDNPSLQLLFERGDAHEQRYLQHLRDAGAGLVHIQEGDITDAQVEQTVAAMRSGAEVIVQGVLQRGEWRGRTDILQRIDRPSSFGGWSYEVTDTKLSQETRGGTILQLCLYSDLLTDIQGTAPEHMYVVTPGADFVPQRYRFADYAAYYRSVRSALIQAVSQHATTITYPEPQEHCEICRWTMQCDSRRRSDDHLCVVAGISKIQSAELKRQSVPTTTRLAEMPVPIEWKPCRGARQSFERLREQARVQVASRSLSHPIYELLQPAAGIGLSLLPPPSSGDIFFDLEGDPFVAEGGLEYLFGYVHTDERDTPRYEHFWAFSREDERAAFERFVDFVTSRRKQLPDLHIYHYAPYEPGALKRLMGRYATREDEIDRLLRAGVFIDLYSIVKQAIRAGVESYGIKRLEPLYAFQRAVKLKDARAALMSFESGFELGKAPATSSETDTILGYNRDDCMSVLHLRDWLEEQRAELISQGTDIPRPTPGDENPSEKAKARQAEIDALVETLMHDMPDDKLARDAEQQARWILAGMLGWHRREDKPVYWDRFRLADLDDSELLEDAAGVAWLQHESRIDANAKCPVDRYRFPPQDSSMRGGESLYGVGGAKLGKVVRICFDSWTIDIKKRQDSADVHPSSIFAHDHVEARAQSDALLRIASDVAAKGLSDRSGFGVARDLLLRTPPQIQGEPLQLANESNVNAAIRCVRKMDGGVLAIQGPPGTGKTYTAARMICALVKDGRKIGIAAGSHKVIRNLLDEVTRFADETNLDLQCVQKVPDGHSTSRIKCTDDNAEALTALRSDRIHVGAATAWFWARPDACESVDVMFVDEAAQISLPNVLAISQACRSIVLLGDPQQLEQPTKGSHPDDTNVSALEHLINGKPTIGITEGLFLDVTWRMHPSICSFTSEQFYEGRLRAHPALARQAVRSSSRVNGTGLRLLTIPHEGNQSDSPEEVEATSELVTEILATKSTWIDREGAEKPITLEDILIIAPYNAQVFELQSRIPGARIGTVDKFQGQEAPIVIYSMTTSSHADAPRGMEFLYSLNRLNVATSRAKCICVLVAAPTVFEPECKSPRQMQLANAFCRYLEVATKI